MSIAAEDASPAPPSGPAPAAPVRKRPGIIGFLRARWQGETPLATLFWRDMLSIGTSVNIVAACLGIALMVNDAPPAISLAVYFSVMPWNLFLFLAVWRKAENESPPLALGARICASLWLALTFAV